MFIDPSAPSLKHVHFRTSNLHAVLGCCQLTQRLSNIPRLSVCPCVSAFAQVSDNSGQMFGFFVYFNDSVYLSLSNSVRLK